MLQISVIFIRIYLIIGLFIGKVMLDVLEKMIVIQNNAASNNQANEWRYSTEYLTKKLGSKRYIFFVYMLSALFWLPIVLRKTRVQ